MTLGEKPPRSSSQPLTYRRLIAGDTHRVPDVLRRERRLELPPSEIPIESYTSREFFDLEVERLWKRVWQMACREEDIPNVGDNIVYDIAGLSIIVVRAAPDRASLRRGDRRVR